MEEPKEEQLEVEKMTEFNEETFDMIIQIYDKTFRKLTELGD